MGSLLYGRKKSIFGFNNSRCLAVLTQKDYMSSPSTLSPAINRCVIHAHWFNKSSIDLRHKKICKLATVFKIRILPFGRSNAHKTAWTNFATTWKKILKSMKMTLCQSFQTWASGLFKVWQRFGLTWKADSFRSWSTWGILQLTNMTHGGNAPPIFPITFYGSKSLYGLYRTLTLSNIICSF